MSIRELIESLLCETNIDEEVTASHILKAYGLPERKVGKWECSDDIFEYALCSCCKWDSGEAWEYALKRFRFCPNCGAEMKGADYAEVH